MIKKSVRGPMRIASRVARAAARNAAQYAARSVYRGSGVVSRNRMRGVKQTVMRMKETHFVDYNHGHAELFHNTYWNGWNLNGTGKVPGQGDGDSQRTGNDIYARGIQVKLMLGCKADRHNTTFRVIVYKCTKGYSITSYGQIFDNQTGNVLLDAVDKDRVKILYDKKHHQKVDVNTYNGNKEITFFRKIWLPHKALYKFYDDATNENNYPYDINILVMAYDAYGTLVTDNIAYIQGWSRFYFKDK